MSSSIFAPTSYDTNETGSYSYITSPSHYTKGTPAELKKYHWFYGNITEEQTKAELSSDDDNSFLVRHTSDTLVISSRIRGWLQHTVIHCSPKGYCLEGKNRHFQSIHEMIKFYQKYPIEEENLQVLGKACDRRASGIIK